MRYKLTRENSLLIIVDIQDRLLKVMDKREELIRNTNILLEMANTFNMKVLVTEQYPKGLGPTVEEIRSKLGSNSRVFEKISFSLYKDGIKEYIDGLGLKNIIIAGIESHICVYQSALDLLYGDYRVYIAGDASFSRKEENRLNGFKLIEKNQGIITNTETILYEILGQAGTEEFKKLSSLIK